MTDLINRLGTQVLGLIDSAGRVLPGQLVQRRGAMHLHLTGAVILVEVQVSVQGIPALAPSALCMDDRHQAALEAADRASEEGEDPTAGRLSRLEIDDEA